MKALSIGRGHLKHECKIEKFGFSTLRRVIGEHEINVELDGKTESDR